jgi:hypothetical protein
MELSALSRSEDATEDKATKATAVSALLVEVPARHHASIEQTLDKVKEWAAKEWAAKERERSRGHRQRKDRTGDSEGGGPQSQLAATLFSSVDNRFDTIYLDPPASGTGQKAAKRRPKAGAKT